MKGLDRALDWDSGDRVLFLLSNMGKIIFISLSLCFPIYKTRIMTFTYFVKSFEING